MRAYLERRALTRRERISQRIAQYDDPRERVLSVFALMAEIAAEPNYRGCAFVNASAEEPRGESKIRQVCNDQRAWVRALFTDLARDLGAADAGPLGRQLGVLYDGGMMGTTMDRDPTIANEARAMAAICSTQPRAPSPKETTRPARRPPRQHARGSALASRAARQAPGRRHSAPSGQSKEPLREGSRHVDRPPRARRPYTFVVMSMLIVIGGV